MFRVGGQVICKPLRGRLLPQETTESSSFILSLLVNADRSFSSADRSSGLLHDLFNHPNSHDVKPIPPEPAVQKTIPSKPAGPVYDPNSNNVKANPPRYKNTGLLEKIKLEFDAGNPVLKQLLRVYRQTRTDKNNDKFAAFPETPIPPAEDADEIFRRMKETRLVPNVVAMVNGLCKDGLAQEATKLFGLMHEKGTIPEVITYTAVVEGYCKAQKLDDAIRIFRKMQSKGITPNAVSYGILIQWLCKLKRLDDAVEFCAEMIEAGHSPNTVTFTGLVDGFCRAKGLEEAQKMINSLREKGFYISEKNSREYLEKKGPFPPHVWEAILGKKPSQKIISLFHYK